MVLGKWGTEQMQAGSELEPSLLCSHLTVGVGLAIPVSELTSGISFLFRDQHGHGANWEVQVINFGSIPLLFLPLSLYDKKKLQKHLFLGPLDFLI